MILRENIYEKFSINKKKWYEMAEYIFVNNNIL